MGCFGRCRREFLYLFSFVSVMQIDQTRKNEPNPHQYRLSREPSHRCWQRTKVCSSAFEKTKPASVFGQWNDWLWHACGALRDPVVMGNSDWVILSSSNTDPK